MRQDHSSDGEPSSPPEAGKRRSIFAVGEWGSSDEERRTYLDVVAGLAPLAPQPLFDMLRELRLREVDRFEPHRRDEVAGHIRAGVAELPALAADLDVEQVVARNTEFRLTRSVDWLYLTACRSVPGLLDELVEYDGLERLQSASRRGPVILAGYHFGPNELMIGGIARRALPITVVASDATDRPGRQYFRVTRQAGSADVQAVSNSSTGALLRCEKALRSGRAVMMFPELSFTMRAERRMPVPFAGRTVWVPLGTVTLASRTGAAVLPCHVERNGGGRYRVVIGEPLPSGTELGPALLAHCERLLRSGLAADWEIWPLVPHIVKEPPQ